jgi:hypothetical protein
MELLDRVSPLVVQKHKVGSEKLRNHTKVTQHTGQTRTQNFSPGPSIKFPRSYISCILQEQVHNLEVIPASPQKYGEEF